MKALKKVQREAEEHNLGQVEKVYKRMLRGYWLTKPDGKEVYLGGNADLAILALQNIRTTHCWR